LAYDPELARPENKVLVDAVRNYFSDGKGDIS
jgi:hypothetical protein